MSVVQSSGTNFGSTTSTSRTFTSAPTSGHLLTAALSMSLAPVGLSEPSGWTKYAELTTGAVRTYLYWKQSDGTETSVAWSWSSGGGFGSVNIKEWDDAAVGPPIVAEDESNASTVVTSQGTGTAVATAATGLALAVFSADTFSNTDGSRAYSNSFSEASADGSSTRSPLYIASKAISGTGNYSCTFSCTDTGDEMYGAIALFQPASGGNTPAPTSMAAAGTSSVSIAARAAARTALTAAGAASVSVTARAAARTSLTTAGLATVAIGTRASALTSMSAAGAATVGMSARAAAFASLSMSGVAAVTVAARATALTTLAIAGTAQVAIRTGSDTDLTATPGRTFVAAGRARTYSRSGAARIFVLDTRRRTF